MPAEAPLLAIAGIAVTLAGFASVVIALRGANPQAWSAQDRFGLGNVVAASVGALLCALVPFPLYHLDFSEAAVWGAANALLGLCIVGAVTFLARSAARTTLRPRRPVMFWSWLASGLLVGGALLAAGLGVLPRSPGMLLIGLLWTVLAAFAQLATFVLVSWTTES